MSRDREVARLICTIAGWGNATLPHPSPVAEELEDYGGCFLCGKPVAPWETQAGARGECQDCDAH